MYDEDNVCGLVFHKELKYLVADKRVTQWWLFVVFDDSYSTRPSRRLLAKLFYFEILPFGRDKGDLGFGQPDGG